MDEDEKVVFRIVNRQTGEVQGVYSRAYHDEYDFPTIEAARNANVHGIYQNRDRYRIALYVVRTELVDPEVD